MAARPKRSSPAVSYTGISSGPRGQRAGADRQRADCEAHCLAPRWKLVEVFCDNDASATAGSPDAPTSGCWRPWSRAASNAIVTWHNDRFHRSPKELKASRPAAWRTGASRAETAIGASAAAQKAEALTR